MTDNNSAAYLAASPSPSEMDVVTHAIILPADHIVFGPEPFETPKGQKSEPLVTLSSAQSALAAMRAHQQRCATGWAEALNEAEAAEAQVLRLTEENEALRLALSQGGGE